MFFVKILLFSTFERIGMFYDKIKTLTRGAGLKHFRLCAFLSACSRPLDPKLCLARLTWLISNIKEIVKEYCVQNLDELVKEIMNDAMN